MVVGPEMHDKRTSAEVLFVDVDVITERGASNFTG